MAFFFLFLVVLPTILAAQPPHRHHSFHASVRGQRDAEFTLPTGWGIPRIGAGLDDTTDTRPVPESLNASTTAGHGALPVHNEIHDNSTSATAVATQVGDHSPSSPPETNITGNPDTARHRPNISMSTGTTSNAVSYNVPSDTGEPNSAILGARSPLNLEFGGGSRPTAATVGATPLSSGTTSITFGVIDTTEDPMSSTLSGIPTSTASDITSSPSNAPASGSKKGLAYNVPALTNAFNGRGISWTYNWGADPDGPTLPGAEFVPMLWGPDKVAGWSESVALAVQSGSKHVLSFNEPDQPDQAFMDPATAARSHIANMNPLPEQMEIGSPAITNGAGPNPLMGTDWLQEFFKQCKGMCRLDFVAFHWYDDATNFASFQQQVERVINVSRSAGVQNVWLTEFGARGADDDVASFVTQATAFLDSTSAVARYAYFMCSDGILLDGNSISSPIGLAYAG